MDEAKLRELATQFVRELESSPDLQEHVADHRRRCQRARALLTVERIPSLTEAEVKELLLDSDAFSFWSNRDREFAKRLEKHGLEGIRQALLDLVRGGAEELTPADLKGLWGKGGLGTLLATEVLAWRYPERYWLYSAKSVLPSFQALGEDIKAGLPRGQKSDAHLYLALAPRMTRIRSALAEAGMSDPDNLDGDLFLWWVKRTAPARRGYWKISPGKGAWAWDEFRSHNLIAIGWEAVGDLSAMQVHSEDELREEIRGQDAEGDRSLRHAAQQLWCFYREMKPGDLVCAYGKMTVLGWGEITGDYRHEVDGYDQPHRRSVRWEAVPPYSASRLPDQLAKRLRENCTIIPLTEADFAQIKSPPPPPNAPDVAELLTASVTSRSLAFAPWQLATFYTALQTKGFVILSGISGTGKTKLAQVFAEALPQPVEGNNWLFLPVRPDWRDSKSLLGYYNPLTRTYESTAFLEFVKRAADDYESGDRLAWFVILDEMNLAHVEYYFADLLSVLESGRDDEGWTKESLRFSYPEDVEGIPPPRELRLPPNLYLVGTVNVDETTQAFSPKVLDRAFTLELTEADFANYPLPPAGAGSALSDEQRHGLLGAFSRDGVFARIDKAIIAGFVAENPELRDRLQSLNALLRPHDLHFGYRVFDEIVSFVAAASETEIIPDFKKSGMILDAAVLMKVLPKFHGSRGKLEAPLRAVLAWCVNPHQPDVVGIEQALGGLEAGGDVGKALEGVSFQCPRTKDRVVRMLRALYTDGFAAFG